MAAPRCGRPRGATKKIARCDKLPFCAGNDIRVEKLGAEEGTGGDNLALNLPQYQP